MDETLQMNPQVSGRSASAQLKPKDGFGVQSTPAKQRFLPLVSGSLLETQLLSRRRPVVAG